MAQKNPPRSSGKDPRTQPRRRWLRRVVVAMLVVPVLLVGALFYLARSEPAHWKAHRQRIANTSPEQMEAVAQAVEDRLARLGLSGAETRWLDDQADAAAQGRAASHGRLTIGADGSITGANMSASIATDDAAGVMPVVAMPLSEVRVDIERTLLLSQEEIDALIVTRLDQWMTDRGYVMPSAIRDPMLQLTDRGMRMAFEYRSKQFSQVITAEFDLEIFNDGYAELRMTSFDAGRLPVPTSQIASYLEKSGEDAGQAAKVGKWLSRLEKLEFKPVLELDDRRRARVTHFVIKPEGVELTLRLQDHNTYRKTNAVLAAGKATLDEVDASALASVPTSP